MEAANKIAIITDTCCDLPQEYLKEYPIFCVPLVVTSGTESYRDNIDITVETIYARQKNENFKTSLPRPQDIEDVYSAIARQGYTSVGRISRSAWAPCRCSTTAVLSPCFPAPTT